MPRLAKLLTRCVPFLANTDRRVSATVSMWKVVHILFRLKPVCYDFVNTDRAAMAQELWREPALRNGRYLNKNWLKRLNNNNKN